MLSLTLDYAQVDLTQEKSHKNPKFLLIARPLSVYLFCTPGKEYHSQADLTSQSCYSVNAVFESSLISDVKCIFEIAHSDVKCVLSIQKNDLQFESYKV